VEHLDVTVYNMMKLLPLSLNTKPEIRKGGKR